MVFPLNFFRICFCLLFLFLFFVLIFIFLFTRKPVKKIIVLAFSYNIILFFIIYNLYILKIENYLFNFVTLIIFSCLLNVLTGIFIINNITDNNYVE